MLCLGRKHRLRGLQPELLTVPLTFKVWDQTRLTTLIVPLIHVVKKYKRHSAALTVPLPHAVFWEKAWSARITPIALDRTINLLAMGYADL